MINVMKTLVGMSGLRLERASASFNFILWCVLLAFSYASTDWIFQGPGEELFTPTALKWGALFYVAIVSLLYFGGNSLALCSSLKNWVIKKWGFAKSYSFYEIGLGIAFFNVTLSQGFLALMYSGTLSEEIPRAVSLLLGVLLFGLGVGVKTWATHTTGIDTFYYKDMFLGRALETPSSDKPFVKTGPYKFFDNPMYGVGNLQIYGFALICHSYEGLIAGLIYHACIYGFYFLFEKPFIVRTYLSQ